MQEFDQCVASLNQQLAAIDASDPSWQTLNDQIQQYWNANIALQGVVISGFIAEMPAMETSLENATSSAMKAVGTIAAISHVVGLAAALLVLATAIATAASSGNPAGIIPAAQGVIAAAQTLSG